MKAWVVRDYKEIHMANCLIALAHTKPEGDFNCVEVNLLTNDDLRTHNEKIARAVWEAKTRTFAIGTRDNGHEDPFIRGEVVSKYKYINFDDFLQSPEYKELVGEI